MRVNCLLSDTITVGQQLYLPALATPIPTPRPTVTPTEPVTAELPTTEPTSVEASTVALSTVEASTVTALTTAPPAAGTATAGPLTLETSTVEPLPITLTPFPSSLAEPGDATVVASDSITPTPIPVSLIGGGDFAGERGAAIQEWIPKACEGLEGKRDLRTFSRTLEVGERIYFFACNFANPISATMSRSHNITESVEILGLTSDKLPPFITDKISDTVKAIIEWPALPTPPLTETQKTFTLTVVDDNNGTPTTVTKRIRVRQPRRPHILVVPQAGPLFGTNFMVYYVNFTRSLTLTVDLYRQGQASKGEEPQKLYYRNSRQVPITRTLPVANGDEGWAMAPLYLGPTPVNLYYALSHKGENLEDRQPDWLFWLN
jgi:hypothetical protein